MGNTQYHTIQNIDSARINLMGSRPSSNRRCSYQPASTKAAGDSQTTIDGVVNGCTIRHPVHSDSINCMSAVRPGVVITGCKDSIVSMVNMDSGECVRKWLGHSKEVTKVLYKNMGGRHLLLSASRDATVKMWAFNSQAPTADFLGHEFVVTGLDTINEAQFCSGSRDHSLRMWDMNTGQCLINRKHSRNMVTHLKKSRVGGFIAQSSEDKEIKMWDERDLTLIHQFPKKNQIQTHCDVFPDGNYILSCSNGFNSTGCEISLWDVRQRQLLREMKGNEETVQACINLPQQITWKRLALSGADHTVRIWNVDDGSLLGKEYIPSGGDLRCATAFNDGNIAVAGDNACLCHMQLCAKGGQLALSTISMQIRPCHTQSQSTYSFQ